MCIFLTIRLIRYARRRRALHGGDASNSIVLVGSSNFSFWSGSMNEDLPGLPLINRAVAGWTTGDILDNQRSLLSLDDLSKAPRLVVVQCGSNDLRVGSTPENAARRMDEFAFHLPPTTHMIIVGSFLLPNRVGWAERMNPYNRLCEAICHRDPARRTYVDPNGAIQANRQLFRWDGIHLNRAGYRALASVVRPVIERQWQLVQAQVIVPQQVHEAPVVPPPAANPDGYYNNANMTNLAAPAAHPAPVQAVAPGPM